MMLTTTPPSVTLYCPQLQRDDAPTPAQESLRTLTPVQLRPEWHHSAPNCLSRLHRIHYIEVVRAATLASCGKSQEYVVHVFYAQPQSHIPTVMWGASARTTRNHIHKTVWSPVHQATHSVGRFCSLRNVLHSCIDSDFRISRCDACERLGHFMTSGGGRPLAFGTMTLDAESDASELLTGFLNHLVNACQPEPASEEATGCHGKRQIANVLHEFLFRS